MKTIFLCGNNLCPTSIFGMFARCSTAAKLSRLLFNAYDIALLAFCVGGNLGIKREGAASHKDF